MNRKTLPDFLLRFGLAFVFSFAAFEIFRDPRTLTGYTPDFIFEIVQPNVFMYSFAAFEVALALWLLSGKKTLIPALLSAGAMFSIIIFNLAAFDVVFRNVAIMFGALSLASMHMDFKGAPSEKVSASASHAVAE
jgi:hypothetical protein